MGAFLWQLSTRLETTLYVSLSAFVSADQILTASFALQTAHFKLINAMARSCLDHNEPLESELSAWRFHAQLHESGLDRIILVRSLHSPHSFL